MEHINGWKSYKVTAKLSKTARKVQDFVFFSENEQTAKAYILNQLYGETAGQAVVVRVEEVGE